MENVFCGFASTALPLTTVFKADFAGESPGVSPQSFLMRFAGGCDNIAV